MSLQTIVSGTFMGYKNRNELDPRTPLVVLPLHGDHR